MEQGNLTVPHNYNEVEDKGFHSVPPSFNANYTSMPDEDDITDHVSKTSLNVGSVFVEDTTIQRTDSNSVVKENVDCVIVKDVDISQN
ncbi:hypothetical protein L1987_09362 [Smallanthus sonchifolius]|uniref:Uncharacterized protein n=1 Tax=Smallanthus sonchifolius TaxID=185202 RepID=A0ACB9JN86_9ASTR|nr:hypothetical protein L1987_09362 [Smallanthus sonchifolius]